jgi:hypothetical protein
MKNGCPGSSTTETSPSWYEPGIASGPSRRIAMRSGFTPKLQQYCSLALADPWISVNDQTDVRENAINVGAIATAPESSL